MDIINLHRPKEEKGFGMEKTGNKGLVFIPDISGFTELVRSTDLITGKNITYELLSTIIEHNVLNLEIAEIEGDAVFFYQWRPIPPVEDIMRQFETLKKAFDERRDELEKKYKIHLNLHIKAIAHYGNMSSFFLGGFRKLYGEVVVEAHRLMKNSIREHSYLLMTNEIMDAAPHGNKYTEMVYNGARSGQLHEIYGDLRINYTYIHFDRTLTLSA
jgi:hypothetical protein